MQRVLGVLAGRDMPPDQLSQWAASADLILAADAGADALREVGSKPQVVLGDFDSILDPTLDEDARHMPEQDSTDCDKLLAYAAEIGILSLTLAAVEGDQLDHMLATLHSAARSPLAVRIALRRGIGWVLKQGDELRIASKVGRRVSLIPLTASEGATLKGVEWPLEKSPLSPLGTTSISNRAASEEIYVHLWEGAAFLFVEFPVAETPQWD